MNISPIKVNTQSFAMKFAPEIEEKYLLHLNEITDENQREKFTKLKQEADRILDRVSFDDNSIKYGSIVRKGGKDFFRHTINSNGKTLKNFTDEETNSINNFFGYLLWHAYDIYLNCCNKNNLRK